MATEICDLLKIKYPILQGAMAQISDASLAAAVSNAGGLGIIAGGNADTNIIREEIRKTKKLTNKPFGLNIMLLSSNIDEIAALVISENIGVVTTGAGTPFKYIDKWKENGTIVIPVVASVAQAKQMQKIGADAIIVEGMEAGGHIGKLTTMALVPQIVDAVTIPVIAAGGIGDGRGFAAARMLGAKGVQLGTRFLVANECSVHENYKEKILKANDIDTAVTGQKTGHPVRVLRNKLSRQFEMLEKENADSAQYDVLGKGALYKSAKLGDVENGSIMAGQIAGLVNKRQSASEIIEELMVQCEAVISKNR